MSSMETAFNVGGLPPTGRSLRDVNLGYRYASTAVLHDNRCPFPPPLATQRTRPLPATAHLTYGPTRHRTDARPSTCSTKPSFYCTVPPAPAGQQTRCRPETATAFRWPAMPSPTPPAPPATASNRLVPSSSAPTDTSAGGGGGRVAGYIAGPVFLL